MFEKILFPTFSKASMKGLKYVRRMKDCGAKEVVLLHVIDFEDLLLGSCSENVIKLSKKPVMWSSRDK